MTGIDSTFYPHIVDEILAFAVLSLPRTDLLSLRATNRRLQERVDNYLAYHFDATFTKYNQSRHPLLQRIFFPQLLEILRQAPDLERLKANNQLQMCTRHHPSRHQPSRAAKSSRAPTYHDHSECRWYLLLRLRLGDLRKHTRVLDWAGNSKQYDAHPNEHSNFGRLLDIGPRTAFPSLRVMRIVGLEPVSHLYVQRLESVAPDHLPLPPYVWFHRLQPTPAGRDAHYRRDPIPTTRLTWTVTFHPFDTALHHTSKGGKAWVPPFFTSDVTQEFVFLFVPDESRAMRLRENGRAVRPRAAGEVDWSDYRTTEGVLGVLEDVVYHTAPELERSHIFAGLERLPPQALGLAAGTTQQEVFDAVRQGIRDMLLKRRDKATDRVVHADLWPDEVVEQCVAKVQILTLDEYREMVGEEQFEYESKIELSRGGG